ncbi:MAG: CHAT domain-containing protein [Gemmatimonadaceae bacterium]
MHPSTYALAIALLSQGPTRTPQARDIVRQAEEAVHRHSVASAESRWRAALRAHAADRAALLGAATLARLTYRYPSADSLIRILRQGPADQYSVWAAVVVAQSWRERARDDSASSWFRMAAIEAIAVGDSAAAAIALAERAVVERAPGRDALMDSLRRAASRLYPANDPEAEAYGRCSRTWPQGRGASRDRLADADRGAQLAEQAGALRLATWCRFIAADARARAGSHDATWRDMRAIAETAEALGDHYRAADVRGVRGATVLTVGAIGDAILDLRRSVASARKVGNTYLEAWSLSNLAQSYFYLGDQVTASRVATEAIALLDVQPDAHSRALALSLRGDLATTRMDYAAAADAYRGAMRRFASIRFPDGVAHTAGLLAMVTARAGDVEGARDVLRQVRVDVEAYSPLGHQMDYQLGALALRTGRLDEAERYFSSARAGEQDEGDLRFVIGARMAELHLRRGNLALAERELTTASDAFDAWRARIAEDDTRALALQATQDEPDPDLGIATILSALAGAGRVEASFALAERHRARALLDRVATLVTLGDSGGNASQALAQAARAPLPSPAEIRRSLSESVAILEFVTGLGGEPTTIFLVTRDSIRSFSAVPIDTLAPRITRLRTMLEAGGESRALAAQLGRELLGRIMPVLPPSIAQIVVVPDGVLHRLPFDALLLPDGRYLFERAALSVAPSASIVTRLIHRPPHAGTASLLAFADPLLPGDSSGGNDAEVYRSAFAANGGLPRLRSSGEEVRRVARFAPASRVLMRGVATEALLKRERLEGYRIIHFATHALVDEGAPTRTALALSPGDGEDGFVGPAELSALSLTADLVVLSACRSASGRLVRGEGIEGLTGPLLAAGARSVLATQWPIGDRATVPFIEGFYGALADGETVGEALRTARLASLRAGESPNRWAAFTLIGDPTISIGLQHPSRFPRSRWAALVAVIAALLLVVLFRRLIPR